MTVALDFDVDRINQIARAKAGFRSALSAGLMEGEALTELCHAVERLCPDGHAGMTISDAHNSKFERAIFPSLPPSFAEAIRGVPIGDPFVGSCAEAVFRGQLVSSDNLAKEVRFTPRWRDLCLGAGLQSIQSQPVFSSEGRALGTFVLGYREARQADAWDAELLRFGADGMRGILQDKLRRAG